MVTSASIITLPGIPALEQIHRKSTPLWLPEEAYDRWLSPEVTDVMVLEELLSPGLRTDLMATPINKVSVKQPVGEPFLIQS
ncbi:SOS response-associated peptidase family protein [Alcanivorax sp.]|uniref:SOS response-associated peptidase family protein n=1 Tax=Alcanivorax sp. TaxID=1872427 RepID=UPI0025BAF07E|nr:SOS response-associated peptidase family protein [Alcanivorax sp.]